jgi:hypothetical protein
MQIAIRDQVIQIGTCANAGCPIAKFVARVDITKAAATDSNMALHLCSLHVFVNNISQKKCLIVPQLFVEFNDF